MGLTPYINRVICYNNTKSGYLTKKPEKEELTLEKLEQLVTNESLPEFDEPIVESTY